MKKDKKSIGKFKNNVTSIFDPHHGIERQSLWMATSVVLLIGGFGYSQMHYNHHQYETLMTVDQSGSTATFSKTSSTTLKLGKTHLSTNGKTAFIPITFNSTDNVGIHANDYKVYIGASTGDKMSYKVRGQMIMYGSNGRAVIVLKSNKKIVNEPLALFILNNKKVSTVDEADADSTIEKNGTSSEFGKYDVAAFKVNPGAIDVKHHDRLDAQTFQVQNIYEELFGSDDIKKIHKQIGKDNKQIDTYKNAATALVERLQSEGYTVPSEPAWMKSSWRPFDAVNLETGRTANGRSALSYQPDSSSDNDRDSVKFPDNLKNSDGTTTDDANNNSNNDSSTSSTSSSASSSDNPNGKTQSNPSTQWTNLQTAWSQIKTLKRDIYITQYAQVYKIRKQERSILNQSSMSSPKHFKQIEKK